MNLKIGTRVRITRGPLAGKTGSVAWVKRDGTLWVNMDRAPIPSYVTFAAGDSRRNWVSFRADEIETVGREAVQA